MCVDTYCYVCTMKRFFPPLVSGVILLNHPPWMKYLYVQSYAELDALLTQEAGTDWKQQPWAQYWMRSYWTDQKRESRSRKKMTVDKTERKKNNRLVLPRDMLLSLIEAHKTLSKRSLLRLLRKEYGISISYYALCRLLHVLKKE